MHVNIDNGYDAWSVYNTYTTYSNQPGRDSQLSNGAALRLSYTIDGLGQLRSVSSAADSHIVYSFDDDWGNDPFWLATTGYAPYDYYQSDDRNRRTLAEDLRLIGDPSRALFGRLDWLLGVYALRLTESDRQVFTWNAYDAAPDGGPGAGSSGLNSQYAATNVALYGSLAASIGPRTTLSGGLRLERRDASYSDSADATTPFPEQINDMLGGNLSWMHLVADGEHLYTTLARGYKGGGFNIGSGILSEQRSFGPESLWSLESGLKFERTDSPVSWDTDVFYMRRQHMQVYLSEQLQQNNPLEYLFFTQNAADGENYGWESQGSYRLGANWQFSGSAALLHTRYLGVGGAFTSLGHRWAGAAVRAGLRGSPRPSSTTCPAAGSRAWIRMRSTASTTTPATPRPRTPIIWRICASATAAAPGPQACLGTKSVRCAVCPAGFLFRADTAQLPEPVLSPAGRSTADRDHRRLRSAPRATLAEDQ
jgi:iron complex outermembrane receptor protein